MKASLCEFLAAFYPNEHEPIYLRVLGPRNAPKGPMSSPRKMRVTRAALSAATEILETLHGLNATRGVYFVVNAGGNQDKDINRFNAFFCENDNLPIAEQLVLLNASPLKPSILVQTLKSIHSYWLISGPCSEKEWRDGQQRLIDYFRSDAAIKNPSRVMRLPYFNHVSLSESGELLYKNIEIIDFEPLHLYTVQEFFKSFPDEQRSIIHLKSQDSQSRNFNKERFNTWNGINSELLRRILIHPTCKVKGEWAHLRGICHNGKGNTSLSLHIPSGAYKCKAGCSTATVLQAFDLPARPSNEERTTIDDRCFADRVQFIINETGSERQSLIDALIRDLVSSTDILAIENAGRKLKDAKVLALGIWRRLIKEERERQRQLQYVTRQTRDRDERKRRLQELINVECSLEIIHEVLSQTTSSPYSHDVIELALATSVSHLLSDEVLLWLLIVGPPSSDKTQTALSIKDAAQVFHIDTLTENAFISGFVSPDGRSTQDLLAALDGYCLTIKDLNSLFGQHPEKVAKILGDLTAIYDGAFAKWTGTRGNVSYNARFSIIGCVTPMTLGQHHRYMSMVGARFLSYRISELNAEDVEEGFDTIWKNHKESKSRLRQLASAYATQLHHQIVQDGLSLPSFSEQAICELNSMARFLAYARAAVRTQRTDSITKIGKTVSRYDIVEVQREEPFRALQQLRVLAMALALIHRRNEVTSHELELCRRVVLSSMPYDRSLILSLFRDPNSLIAGDGGLTRKAAAKGLGVARNQVVRLLTELEFIGVLKGEKSGNKWQENEVWTYFPTSKEFLSILSKPTPPLDHNRDLKKTFLALA